MCYFTQIITTMLPSMSAVSNPCIFWGSTFPQKAFHIIKNCVYILALLSFPAMMVLLHQCNLDVVRVVFHGDYANTESVSNRWTPCISVFAGKEEAKAVLLDRKHQAFNYMFLFMESNVFFCIYLSNVYVYKHFCCIAI